MIKLHFEKIYNTERKREHIFFGVPFEKGILPKAEGTVVDEFGEVYPSHVRATAFWDDGSVKWLFVRCMVDLPKNDKTDYYFNPGKTDYGDFEPVVLGYTKKGDISTVKSGSISVYLSKAKNRIFDDMEFSGKSLGNKWISAPILEDSEGVIYEFVIDKWFVKENSPICTVVTGIGKHKKGVKTYSAQINLTFYAEKNWFELGYKITNTDDEPLEIKSLSIHHLRNTANTRNTVSITNHDTEYITGEYPELSITADRLLYEANEHFSEVFYGTFFGDCSDEKVGLCATFFQPQQNFPKGLRFVEHGMCAEIVPGDGINVVLESGMAREQKILFHFHNNEDLKELNNRSIIYQMPDRPGISPDVFERAGVFEDVFPQITNPDMETFLIGKGDEHSKCYGMLHWGDSPNMGYTDQGRGGGKLVWSNNEYDFPHACALMYVRTGIRRFMDYMIVSGKHQMDVDICHHSFDPLQVGGQWEHSERHCKNSKVVCSHQWVEGLLDYYHLTGDTEAYRAAIGIGENVIRLLDSELSDKTGYSSARETGWALRTLTALYLETNDSSLLGYCDKIVDNFKIWKAEYGQWLSPYLENTAIRVVFMISVAACSLMRYYRVNKNPEIRDMILSAVDDLIENARLDNGLFYYKELPSLRRQGGNPIILEALAYAYELTEDKKYLEAGLPTMRYVMKNAPGNPAGGKKTSMDDCVLCGTTGTKGFAQMFVPVATFAGACAKAKIL